MSSIKVTLHNLEEKAGYMVEKIKGQELPCECGYQSKLSCKGWVFCIFLFMLIAIRTEIVEALSTILIHIVHKIK